jgi:hypothetical protein
MTEAKTETQAPEAKAAKEPVKKVDIIRGRMPVAMVYAVRFGNLAEASADKQRLFATTVGKIYDIEKGRNFGYVTEDVKFTQEQIDDGIDWIEHHPEFKEQGADKVVKYLKALPIASEEDAAKFEELRKALRGQNTKTKDGETADAGGGNRRKGKTKAEKQEDADAEAAETADSADDLLG